MRSPLGNWHRSNFVLDGVQYSCGEQWMMAQKAKLFGDEEIYNEIMGSHTAKKQKDLGRKVRGFKENVWVEKRFSIVKKGLKAKFDQNPHLRTYLLNTGDQILVEANPCDPIWAIGLSEHDRRCHDPSKWKGLNLLGKILMEIREELSCTKDEK